MSVPLDQLTVALGFFERVQVLALDILDQRDLGCGRIVDLANDRRDAVQPGPLRREPAALPGDDHVILAVGPQQDGLKHAALPDRFGKLVERALVELDTRLSRVWGDPGDVDLADGASQGGRVMRSGW